MSHVFICQFALRRGTAKAYDHAQLVHEQWLQAAVEGKECVS